MPLVPFSFFVRESSPCSLTNANRYLIHVTQTALGLCVTVHKARMSEYISNQIAERFLYLALQQLLGHADGADPHRLPHGVQVHRGEECVPQAKWHHGQDVAAGVLQRPACIRPAGATHTAKTLAGYNVHSCLRHTPPHAQTRKRRGSSVTRT